MSIPDEISVNWAADAVPEVEDENLYPGSCRCGTHWYGEAICHCAACHLTFTTIGPFDAHRVGKYPNRRCQTEKELRERGYEPNTHGHWRKPRPAGSIPRSRDG